MSSNTLYDHVEAIVSALGGDTELNTLAETQFGAPLLVTLGTWFGGQDRELGIEHAPFVAVTAGDGDAEIELYRPDGPAPRAFEVRIITGVPMIAEQCPPLPKAADRLTGTVYRAGQGAAGEQFHLAVLKLATEVFSCYGLTPQTASAAYSGSTRFPLETFDSTITFATPRTLNTGAL